jgi:hypothetical protein
MARIPLQSLFVFHMNLGKERRHPTYYGEAVLLDRTGRIGKNCVLQ